jgi:hypothetical protein
MGLETSSVLSWSSTAFLICRHMTAYRLLMGKPEGKITLGRPRRRWLANIKMDLREIVWSDVVCTDLTLDRGRGKALVNVVMNLLVP